MCELFRGKSIFREFAAANFHSEIKTPFRALKKVSPG